MRETATATAAAASATTRISAKTIHGIRDTCVKNNATALDLTANWVYSYVTSSRDCHYVIFLIKKNCQEIWSNCAQIIIIFSQ